MPTPGVEPRFYTLEDVATILNVRVAQVVAPVQHLGPDLPGLAGLHQRQLPRRPGPAVTSRSFTSPPCCWYGKLAEQPPADQRSPEPRSANPRWAGPLQANPSWANPTRKSPYPADPW